MPPRPDWNGRNSGPDFAFLYPNLTTALFGEWKDGFLVSAQPARLNDLSLEQDGILEPTFSLTNDRQEFEWLKEDRFCLKLSGI